MCVYSVLVMTATWRQLAATWVQVACRVYTDQTYSCPRDWHLSATGGPIEGPPEVPRTSQHYHIEGIKRVPDLGTKGIGSMVFSVYSETVGLVSLNSSETKSHLNGCCLSKLFLYAIASRQWHSCCLSCYLLSCYLLSCCLSKLNNLSLLFDRRILNCALQVNI